MVKTKRIKIMRLVINDHYYEPKELIKVIPFLALFTKGSTRNLTSFEEDIAKKDRLYDFLLYGLVPIQYAILLYFLFQLKNSNLAKYFINFSSSQKR